MADGVLVLAAAYFEQYLAKIRTCVQLLDEHELWWRPNDHCNSVGNLLLHLSGNLSQWILEGVGGEPFDRRRSAEFSARRTASGAELVERVEQVVGRCREVVLAVSADQLVARRSIQDVDTDVQGAIIHAVEHMSYHTGQIVFVCKQLAGERSDIEFYPRLRGG
jgi:uncharacterized damage-inducible protein DinB